jgi:hypothetical protein
MTMSTVNAISTNHSTPVAPADDLAQTDSSDGGISLLPDPVSQLAFSGDVGAEITALAVQTGGTERRNDETERDAVESLQEQRNNDQVKTMRDRAGALLGQAIAEGAGTIVQGGLVMTGAVSKTPVGPTSVWSGAGEIADGMGKVVGGLYQAGAANDDANGTADKNDTDRLATVLQNIHDDGASASQLILNAMQFLQEYAQTQAQTRNAALHGA